MGAPEVAMNAYVVYSMLGVIILLAIATLGLLLRVLYVVDNLAGRVTALEKSLVEFRQEMAAHVIRLDTSIDQLGARIDRVQATLAVFGEQTSASLGELRGMVMALNQKIDLLMRHHHDAVSDDVLLAPTAPEIAAD